MLLKWKVTNFYFYKFASDYSYVFYSNENQCGIVKNG